MGKELASVLEEKQGSPLAAKTALDNLTARFDAMWPGLQKMKKNAEETDADKRTYGACTRTSPIIN